MDGFPLIRPVSRSVTVGRGDLAGGAGPWRAALWRTPPPLLTAARGSAAIARAAARDGAVVASGRPDLVAGAPWHSSD